MNIQDLVAEAHAFIEHAMPSLGYTECWFDTIRIDRMGNVKLSLLTSDDFQDKVSYSHQKQVGYIFFDYPFTTRGKLNREQRELHVLAAQTADSTAMADALTSAAGRRFAQEIIESRARFAVLRDMREEEV